jgi:hypothetical protein
MTTILHLFTPVMTFLPGSDLFGIEWWSWPDTLELLLRFLFNLLVITVISRYLYYRISRRKEYYFTYILIGTTVFFISFLLESVKLEIGFALGLFAVFGILRYRTDTIPIKEMTFLFVIIAISVINALAGAEISYTELLVTNLAIVTVTWAMERLWSYRQETQKKIIYERIELIKPENYGALLADLEDRTGLKINRIEVGDINFLRDTAEITIFYHPYEEKASRKS